VTGALELRGISAGYEGTTVLRDVDLVAPAGRVTAIIGPNGAGKTTLLRVAAGLLPPDDGAVLVDGQDTASQPYHRTAREGVCFVPEGRAVFPTLTVRENLALFARTDPADVLRRSVEAFPRLGERLDQVAGTLSGGEQQMLAPTRAYADEPRYVLLDEVSMGLAPKVVEEIFGFLRRLAAGGAALVIVEQYVHQVLELADVVYVLNRGRVAFAGEPSEVDADALAAEYLGAARGGSR
jgi:branched-chain amino acid transport system ATP-binding protein